MTKLIIVDDESRIRRGLRNCIDWDSIGIDIVGEASDGFMALEICKDTSPDIVITDIKMPRMDGLEFIKKLREKYEDLHIIIISGYSDFSFAQKAIRYNVNDYILKPVKETELKEIILKCITNIKENKRNKPDNTQIVICDEDRIIEDMNNKIIKQSLKYIHENYKKDINLFIVADEVHLHPNYFCTLFKNVVGESYSKYIIKLRLAKAKEMLKDMSYKGYEISKMVGYNDFRYFSKLFKHFEGVTPTEYRNKH